MIGRLDITRQLFAPAVVWPITYFILATLVLAEVPSMNPEMAPLAFGGLAQLSC